MKKSGMILSISGIGPARTAEAYRYLRQHLQGRLPETQLKFVGNPFSGWPHPLNWINEKKEERDKHATTRLFDCWAVLNEFVVRNVVPALDEGAIVVTQRFGLDALLYATALHEHTDQNEAAEEMHHEHFVPMRIKRQGIPIPYYFIPSARPETITSEWLASSTSLAEVDPEELRRYIVHDDAMMKRYFDKKHGQNPPVWLDASQPTDIMCETAMLKIVRLVGKRGNESATSAA